MSNDRINVIENLELNIRWIEDIKAHQFPGWQNVTLAMRDAIEELTTQEPAEIEIEGGGSTWWHVCGECHGAVDTQDLYCKHCGRPLRR